MSDIIVTPADLALPHVVKDAVDGKAYIRRQTKAGGFEYMDLGDRPYWFPKSMIERTFTSVDDAKHELRLLAERVGRNTQADVVVAILRTA